jgi:hypothetical protein
MATRKTGIKARAKKKSATTKRKASSRITLATLAAQIADLSEQIATLTELVRGSPSAVAAFVQSKPKKVKEAAKTAPPKAALRGSDLLAAIQATDRRGRHGGLVPIPEVRAHFVADGWTRERFDEELLQAERDFVVDLKTADDPARLAAPSDAIRQNGRGYLQFVVIR